MALGSERVQWVVFGLIAIELALIFVTLLLIRSRASLEHSADSSLAATRSADGETRSLLDAIMTNSPFAVALFDSERRIVTVNAAAQKFTGLSAAAHRGKRNGEVITGDLAAQVDTFLEKVLNTRESFLNVPVRGRLDAGDVDKRDFLFSFFPVVLPGGSDGAGLVVLETTQYRQLAG